MYLVGYNIQSLVYCFKIIKNEDMYLIAAFAVVTLNS